MSMSYEVERGVQWTSTEAREAWAPVLASAQLAWSRLEIMSVPGERSSALIYMHPRDLPAATAAATPAGLSVVVLEWAAGRGEVRVAITGARVQDWIRAHGTENHELAGKMLGYPECCRESFVDRWIQKRMHDPATAFKSLEGPWQMNGLLRHLSIRITPWMACSEDCTETRSRAERYITMGREHDVDIDSIERMLSLELRYSAKNGIAIVTSPVFRYAHDTDLPNRELVRPGVTTVSYDPPRWTDNGFRTYENMRLAHNILLTAIGDEDGTALDLGSGDGLLLDQIPGKGARVGIEKDGAVVKRGRQRNPRIDLRESDLGNVMSWPTAPDLVLLSPNRLLEMSKHRADDVRTALRSAGRIIAYAYDDNIRLHGSLDELLKKTKLQSASAQFGTKRIQAKEVTA